MQQILNESPVTLAQAANSLPGRPHCSSLWRWCRKGLKDIRLEYARVGRKIITSKEALCRFTEALAAADATPTPRAPLAPRGRSEKQRARDVERARLELAEAGI